MSKPSFLPFDQSAACHEYVVDCVILQGILTRDFGPWKQGQHANLTFDFEAGTVTEHDDDGGVVRRETLKLDV